MEDLIKSLKATLYERTKSPVWGTLIIAFVTYNWKFFFCMIKVKDFELGRMNELPVEMFPPLDS